MSLEELIEYQELKKEQESKFKEFFSLFTSTLESNESQSRSLVCKLPKEKNGHLASYYPLNVRIEPKIGRNEVCSKCDSGKRYKRCCGIRH